MGLFTVLDGRVENVGKCCAVVLHDESVHEINGHLVLLVEVKRTHMPLPHRMGVRGEAMPLPCCLVARG
jgi:hypothetical protein